MKKTFILSFMLLGGMFSAQAADHYYVGANHLNNLLQSIEESILDTADPPAPLTEFPDMPGGADKDGNKGIEDGAPEDGDWENIGGVSWTENIKIPDYTEDDNKPSDTNYRAVTAIDWSPAIYSYTQKADVDIVWVQPNQAAIDLRYEGEQADKIEPPTLTSTGDELTVALARKAARSVLQRGELRFLESLNLSGNQFRSITIDGSDLVPLELIDLSNNPTLTTLTLKNLPILTTLDVTGCPNVVLDIDNCPDVEIIGAPATGFQAPDATGSLISAANGQVIIKGALNETATIYAVDGRLVAQQKLTDETATIALASSGVYVVRLSNGTVQKVLVK